MKSLYNEDHRYTYTKPAEALDMATFQAINPLFMKWAEDGYSPREIAHIMQAAINEMELNTIIDWNKNEIQTEK